MKKSAKKRRSKKLWQLFLVCALLFSIFGGFYALSAAYNYLAAQESQPNSSVAAESAGKETPTLTSNLSPSCGSPTGGPADNPIAAKYGSSAYPPAGRIKWNCVYNIRDFKGSSMVERFNSARDAAAAAGGGVVYFPAGTYNFTDSISLKNGVVIRGETPAVKDAKSSAYAPLAKLVFPKYEPKLSGSGTPNETAFKKILTAEPNRDSNIGIVNVDVNRAGISWEGDADAGQNKNIIVFGIRNNNVAEPDPRVPDTSFQEPWVRYSYRFGANLKINASENVLVANNRINDAITDSYEQPGYKVKALKGNEIITYSEGSKVPFHYGNHYAIVVNRSKSGGYSLAAGPQTEPGLFRKGIVIRDNWVYHTMRVAIQASGEGLVIQDNQIKDESRKQWWTDPTGTQQPQGAVTLENRAIDWSGWNVRIEGNSYEVYRHQVMDSRYLSVDGEGILIQECCGGTTVRGASISKNQGNSYIGLYKVPEIRNVRIADNKLLSNITNTPLIYVVADTNNSAHSMEGVRIEGNTVSGDILAKASAGGSGNAIRNNAGNNSGAIEASCHVAVSGNSGFQEKPCLQ
ncbi:glycosyl hydrolase family 28-related protein [Kamptonema formosum]|uniref:glycosyl hydrolase family 28-related protein n=1 Tax=Kamptonema formosum TaxID=331992 RepID=UPI00034D0FC1|nr:glycosyl hydrolase family 28-related protein [Oscillatoria sp. PCC 10802]